MASLAPFRPLASSSSSRTTSALLQQTSSFSTTSSLLTKTIQPQRLPKHFIPPYPYGPRLVYKQSNTGLYGLARIQTGNNVSEAHGVKTARFWRPNIHVRIYRVPSLNCRIKTKVSMRVLKTIEKEGGLENYLTKSKPQRIKELGPAGWSLRWLVMQTEQWQAKMNAERVELGLPTREIVDNSRVIEMALDCATPGKLSLASRATKRELDRQDMFDIAGWEKQGDGLGQLTPEEQAELEATMSKLEGMQSHVTN